MLLSITHNKTTNGRVALSTAVSAIMCEYSCVTLSGNVDISIADATLSVALSMFMSITLYMVMSTTVSL